MKGIRLLMVVAATALAAGTFAACGSEGDTSAQEESVQEVQRRNWGAYGCMPPALRRRFDRLSDRYEVVYGRVVGRLPPGVGQAAQAEALSKDRTAVRLLRQLRSVILPYYPGGREYEQSCYQDAVERYERRAAR